MAILTKFFYWCPNFVYFHGNWFANSCYYPHKVTVEQLVSRCIFDDNYDQSLVGSILISGCQCVSFENFEIHVQ